MLPIQNSSSEQTVQRCHTSSDASTSENPTIPVLTNTRPELPKNLVKQLSDKLSEQLQKQEQLQKKTEEDTIQDETPTETTKPQLKPKPTSFIKGVTAPKKPNRSKKEQRLNEPDINDVCSPDASRKVGETHPLAQFEQQVESHFKQQKDAKKGREKDSSMHTPQSKQVTHLLLANRMASQNATLREANTALTAELQQARSNNALYRQKLNSLMRALRINMQSIDEFQQAIDSTSLDLLSSNDDMLSSNDN